MANTRPPGQVHQVLVAGTGRRVGRRHCPRRIPIVSAVLRPLRRCLGRRRVVARLGTMVERGVRCAVRPVVASSGDRLAPRRSLRRFGALLIDWMLCLLIAGIVRRPVRTAWLAAGARADRRVRRSSSACSARPPACGWPGSAASSWPTAARSGCPRALLRGVLLALVVPALIMDEDRRGLHDRLAGSVVVGRCRGAARRLSAGSAGRGAPRVSGRAWP